MKKNNKASVGRPAIYTNDEQRRLAHQYAVKLNNAKNTKVISVRFHKENDKELLNYIANIENKTDYIRQLVLSDMNKNKE